VLLTFVVVERRAREPVLPLRLFRKRTVSAATAVNILRAMVLFGLIAYIPLYAQAVLDPARYWSSVTFETDSVISPSTAMRTASASGTTRRSMNSSSSAGRASGVRSQAAKQ